MKATNLKFEVIEVEPRNPDHWKKFDLEKWMAELLVGYYLSHKDEIDQMNEHEVKEKSQSNKSELARSK